MGCFIVPTGVAVVAGVAAKVQKNKEKSKKFESKIPFSEKLSWLTKLSLGGAALLAFEHIWHGEIVPYPPFLSAMENANDTVAMLREISTVGIGMAAMVVCVWIGMLIASHRIEKKAQTSLTREVQ